MKKWAVMLPLAGVAAWGILDYTPPLLGGGFNPAAVLYNVVAFGWWYTRAVWSEKGWLRIPDPVLAARAAWYRPDLAPRLLGVEPGDLEGLAQRYFSLGLDRAASALFAAAASRDPARALDCAAYLGIMGRWKEARQACAAAPGPAAAYWRGRALLETGFPRQALEELEKADLPGPYREEAAARMGEAWERMGESVRALSRYRRVLAAAPGNLCARKGLARLGDPGERAAGARMLSGISPSPVPVGNRFLLAAFSPLPERVRTGQRSRLDLRVLGWSAGGGEEATPLAAMVSGPAAIPWRQGGEPFVPPAPGEVRAVALEWEWPLDIFPGPVLLGVGFRQEPSRCLIPVRGEKGEYIPLGRLTLSPRWVPALPGPSPAPGTVALGRSVFLGPGDAIRLELAGPLPARGLGVISSCRHQGRVSSGDRMGRITVETPAGPREERLLREGKETAGVRAGPSAGPPVAGIMAREGGKALYNYRADFLFHGVLSVSALVVENVSAASGLRIDDIVLIPEAVAGLDQP